MENNNTEIEKFPIPIKIKKYKLLKSSTITIGEKTLFRIKALISFGTIKKGEVGGYINDENCLINEFDTNGIDDDSWIDSSSWAINSRIINNSIIMNDSKVRNSDVNNSTIMKDSRVEDSIMRDCTIINSNCYNSRMENNLVCDSIMSNSNCCNSRIVEC